MIIISTYVALIKYALRSKYKALVHAANATYLGTKFTHVGLNFNLTPWFNNNVKTSLFYLLKSAKYLYYEPC